MRTEMIILSIFVAVSVGLSTSISGRVFAILGSMWVVFYCAMLMGW